SLPWLVAARCLQGLGSAAVMPLGLALLRFTYPRRSLGQAIAWNALAVAGASAAGPAVGAGLLSVASWPWLFAVNLPVGALVLAACTKLPHPQPTGHRVDAASIALNASMFAAFVLGCDGLPSSPWYGSALLGVSAGALVLLVRREMPKAAPLIPLDLLRVPSFRVSIVASVCCFTGQMIGFVALPFYFQHELGLSAMATGLLLTPWPLAVMVADCVPVVLVGENSGGAPVLAVAHAGRPGVERGVVAAVVARMRDAGAKGIEAWLGPSICGQCYEVPEAMRAAVAAVVPEAYATTSWHTPALDLPAAVLAQLAADGVQAHPAGVCTLEDLRFFSHRRAVRDGEAEGRFIGFVTAVSTVTADLSETIGKQSQYDRP
ncbi:MAG: MFS transporter, partial [Specibacter sp.]